MEQLARLDGAAPRPWRGGAWTVEDSDGLLQHIFLWLAPEVGWPTRRVWLTESRI
jgi:hypothetical protein